jgi:hypothetical protein
MGSWMVRGDVGFDAVDMIWKYLIRCTSPSLDPPGEY